MLPLTDKIHKPQINRFDVIFTALREYLFGSHSVLSVRISKLMKKAGFGRRTQNRSGPKSGRLQEKPGCTKQNAATRYCNCEANA